MGPERERKQTHGQYVEKPQSNISKERKGLMEEPSVPRMKYKVIGPGKPKRVSKGPWEAGLEKG